MLVYNVATELFIFESFWFSNPSNLISTFVKEGEDRVAGIGKSGDIPGFSLLVCKVAKGEGVTVGYFFEDLTTSKGTLQTKKMRAITSFVLSESLNSLAGLYSTGPWLGFPEKF